MFPDLFAASGIRDEAEDVKIFGLLLNLSVLLLVVSILFCLIVWALRFPVNDGECILMEPGSKLFHEGSVDCCGEGWEG
jgi:hypothetical protein